MSEEQPKTPPQAKVVRPLTSLEVTLPIPGPSDPRYKALFAAWKQRWDIQAAARRERREQRAEAH